MRIKFIFLGVMLLLAAGAQAQFDVRNNGALVRFAPGCIAQVHTGSFLNNAGTVHNAGNLIVEGDFVNNDVVTGDGASTGVFTVENDWVNNQTFTADQSTVALNGANQNITGTAVSNFHNLILSGSGIKSMTLDVSVLGALSLNGLELATDANTLRILNPASNAISAGNGFVSSIGAGRLSRAMNSALSYIFPLGSSVGTDRIRPLAITPESSNPSTFAARMANVSATIEGYDLALAASDLCQVNPLFYHLIDRTEGSVASAISQYYIAGQDGNWSTGGHWQNAPQWESTGTSITTSLAPYTTVTTAGWTDFSTPAFALVNLAPQVNLSTAALASCIQGNPIVLTGSPAGGVFAGPGIQGTQFVPALAGVGSHEVTYTYTIANGCFGTATQLLEVYTQPQIAITSNQNAPYQLCQGEAITFDATPGFANYEWSNNEQDVSIEVANAGSYSVTATDANGCQAVSQAVNVAINPIPNPVISADGPLEFCEGGLVFLSTSASFGSYNWSNNATSVSTMITTSGLYTVTVTNQFLCEGTSTPVEVNVIGPASSSIENVGDSMYVVPANGSGFQWFLNGNPIPGGTESYYVGQSSGNYTVEFTDVNGCTSTSMSLELTYSGGNTGLYEQDIFSQLDLYPNPGKGIFNINAVLLSEENVLIAVTDMLGKQLIPDVFIQGTNQFNQQVDLTQFANGVYFVRIQVADTSLTVRYIKS